MSIGLYFTVLILTIVIETLVALIFTREKQLLLLVIIAQIITNPALNFLIQSFPELYYNTAAIFLLEAAVVVVEWLFYLAFYKKKPLKLFFLSFVTNAGSYFFGILLQKSGIL